MGLQVTKTGLAAIAALEKRVNSALSAVAEVSVTSPLSKFNPSIIVKTGLRLRF